MTESERRAARAVRREARRKARMVAEPRSYKCVWSEGIEYYSLKEEVEMYALGDSLYTSEQIVQRINDCYRSGMVTEDGRNQWLGLIFYQDMYESDKLMPDRDTEKKLRRRYKELKSIITEYLNPKRNFTKEEIIEMIDESFGTSDAIKSKVLKGLLNNEGGSK